MSKKIDLTGQRFGRLTVIAEGESPVGARRRVMWICRCDCGRETTVNASNLRRGHTTSCGCFHLEVLANRLRTHGGHGTRAYGSWSNMLTRCRNSNIPGWRLYGGRGIRVCEAWLSFEAFYRDMGEPPFGYSLDRIDVDGDYEPGNCRWADDKTQANNKRDNCRATYLGRNRSILEWSEESGIPYATLLVRFRVGDRGKRLFRAVRRKVAK